MISRALNAANDLLLEGSRIATVTEGAQVAQAVRTRLRFYLGEWFLDTAAGVPWFQEILTKPANLSNAENRIKSEILGTEGVKELVKFSLTFDKRTRKLTVTFSATTIYGEIFADNVYLNI
jgi:hypothetical protein